MSRIRTLILGVACAAGVANRAHGSEVEFREFSIHVGGKDAGKCVLAIRREKDGTETVALQASVRVRVLLQNYSLSFESREVWKDGRLWQFQNKVEENGKKSDISGATDGEQLTLRINGKAEACSRDVWTSSFWKLADARYYGKAVNVLETDTGKLLERHLQHVGVEAVTLGGKAQNCYHFRLTGGRSPVDLWYDGALRMVRQEFTEDGHHTVLHLTGLRRQP